MVERLFITTGNDDGEQLEYETSTIKEARNIQAILKSQGVETLILEYDFDNKTYHLIGE